MIFFARLLIVSLFVFISAKTDWSYFFPGFDLSEGVRVVVGLIIGLIWVGLDLIFRRISGRG